MKISKTRDVRTPSRGTELSAGIDFFVPNEFEEFTLDPGEDARILSGIKVQIPENHVLIAFNKSGVALKKGLMVGACVVDEDYQGEISLHVIATKKTKILPGEKLVQFVLLPVSYDSLDVVPESELFDEETSRGSGGFGSTGTR
jgi:dUTP pyrophosphatase